MFLEYCADGDLKEYVNKKEDKKLSEVLYKNIFAD